MFLRVNASVIAWVAALIFACGVIFAIWVNAGYPSDAITYLAAGERLNAGHALYELAPGDRFVPGQPPLQSVPLLSPPLVAVMWRSLAALPNEIGLLLWRLLVAVSVVGAVVLVLRRGSLMGALAVAALYLPLSQMLAVANVDAFILIGTFAIWRLSDAGRPVWAGVVVGGLVVLKLTPIPLAWWLLVRWGKLAVPAMLASGVAFLVIAVAGAGLDSHFAYLDVARAAWSGLTNAWSFSALGARIGLPIDVGVALTRLVVLAGIVAVYGLRYRPRAGFVVAVLTMVFGSPAVNMMSLGLLLGTLAPVLWPEKSRNGRDARNQDRQVVEPEDGRGQRHRDRGENRCTDGGYRG